MFLGLLAAAIGVIIAFPLALLLYIKFAGLELFFDIGARGDHSPITFVMAAICFLFVLGFPTSVWFFLKRYGNLKSASSDLRMISFFLFATLPLWMYLGWVTYSSVRAARQTADENYHAVTDACIIKEGVNRTKEFGTSREVECRNGVLNGWTRTYNSKGILIYEGPYLNGKLNGTETTYFDDGKVKSIINYKDGEREGVMVLYRQDGNTTLYMIYEQGKTRWVYDQSPEGSELDYFDQGRQETYCENQGGPAFQNERYTCLNNVINGEFVRYWVPDGTVLLRAHFVNGVLDGTLEELPNGKLSKHLEYRNGKLDGTVRGYGFEGGALEYEGHYTNGLQNGIFRRYSRQGKLESEVVFEHGQLVKINQLPPFSEIP